MIGRGFWSFAFDDARDPEGLAAAADAAREAAEMSKRMGRVDLELAALDALASESLIQGLYKGNWPIIQRRLELVEQYEDPFEYGDTYSLAAWHSGDVGQWREAVQYGMTGGERVINEIAGIGIHCLSRAAMVQLYLGEWDELLAVLERMREAMAERRDEPPAFAAGAFAAAAVVYEARGESAQADQLVEIVEEVNRTRRAGVPTADAYLALCLGRRAEWGEAFEHLDRHANNPAIRPYAYAARCDLIADAGRWEEAEPFAVEARAWGKVAGLGALPLFADRLSGRAALVAGDAAGAVELLQRAAAGFRDRTAAWELARTELFLAEALLTLGRDASAELSRASEVFESLGALREAEAARNLSDRISRSS
jgi:tetratricopeptide (TPR) repeat protein